LLLAGTAYAASAPANFTGDWAFDPAQSKNVGMMAQGKIHTTVSQTKYKIVVDDNSEFDGQKDTQHTVYDLTGNPETNTSMMAGQATTRSHWEGTRLITDWESAGAIAGTLVRRVETRYLSPDGKTMFVESARPGKDPMIIVFTRARWPMSTMTMTTTSNRATKPGRRRIVLLLLLCAIAAAVGSTWWSQHRKMTVEAGAPHVRWVTPEVRIISSNVNATGTVKLKIGAEVRVGAQLSGIVRRLNVTVGSHVNQGDVIAEIDSRPVTAKIDQAHTQLAQTQVSDMKARTDFARTQKLFEAGIIAAQQYEDSKAALNAADASVTAAQGVVSTAQVDLAYVDIRAPISGTVASIATQRGETVAASFATPTFVTIIQQASLEVIAMVDEADIGNVRRGEKVEFTTETYPDHEFQGIVTRIAPVATIISGVVNYEVAISIERDIALLRPDMTANVNIRTSEHRALLLLSKCIHREGGETFIYVRRPAGSGDKRIVSVAGRMADQTEITRGLNADEEVELKIGGTAK
jgi:RND family efflux transporter MFP subunit